MIAVQNCGAMFVQWKPCLHASLTTLMCLASPSPASSADDLRQQLDSLQKEANTTRTKANNARSRLLRLSEAVEKLRRQAAVSVQTGKEHDARELLFQKKKVMQAMENLKNRIELFDELSAKLNEAISMKEDLLMGNMSLDIQGSGTDSPDLIHIVSPKEETPTNFDDHKILDVDNLKSVEDEELQVSIENHTENQCSDKEVAFSRNKSNNEGDFQGLSGISSYEDFMRDLDQDLCKMEKELETFLRYSTLLLNSKDSPEYSKVQHVMDILEGIRQTRKRISTVMQTSY